MNVLALDTSSLACSVALDAGGERFERHELKAREHTGLLIPMIRGLLEEAAIGTADLDAVILGNGPGSFIGMRIAASVAQGLCHASGARLVAVSSLAALAAEAFAAHGVSRVLVAQDARMRQVYLGRFAAGADGLPRELAPVVLHAADAGAALEADYHAAGAGWERYPELRRANRDRLREKLPIDYPRARWLLPSGLAALRDGRTIDPERLEPAYVRDEVAMPAARRADSKP